MWQNCICPSQNLVFAKLDPWEGQIVYNLHYLAIEDIQIFALATIQLHTCSGIEDTDVHSYIV